MLGVTGLTGVLVSEDAEADAAFRPSAVPGRGGRAGMDESPDAPVPAPGAGCDCAARASDAWAVAIGAGDTVSAEPREAEAS